MVIERFLVHTFGEPRSAAVRVVRWIITFHVVTLAWIFFNARRASVAFDVLGNVVKLLWLDTGPPSQYVTALLVAAIVGVVAWQFVPSESGPGLVARFSDLHPALQGALVGVVMIVCYRVGSVDDFIYFQF